MAVPQIGNTGHCKLANFSYQRVLIMTQFMFQLWSPTYVDSDSKSNTFCSVTIGELPTSPFPISSNMCILHSEHSHI